MHDSFHAQNIGVEAHHSSFIQRYTNSLCRNPSLGLATKAKGCKVVGQERSPGIMSHAPGNARECEGIDPHIPKGTTILGVGVPVDSRIFRR